MIFPYMSLNYKLVPEYHNGVLINQIAYISTDQ